MAITSAVLLELLRYADVLLAQFMQKMRQVLFEMDLQVMRTCNWSVSAAKRYSATYLMFWVLSTAYLMFWVLS